MKKVLVLLLFIAFNSCDTLNFGGDRNICQCDIELTFTDLVFDDNVLGTYKQDVTKTLNSGQLPCRQWFNSITKTEFTESIPIGNYGQTITESFSIDVTDNPDENRELFREREHTISGLNAFSTAAVKFEFKSTSTVEVPKIKNLRVLALAL